MTRMPWLHRLLLRGLPSAEARARAESDLLALRQEVIRLRGRRAADRATIRELLLVVGWAWYDRARQWFEPRPDRGTPRRRGMLPDLFQDLRIGLRGLVRRPGFALVTTGVLALGLSATTSILTVANRLFFQPPPLVQHDGELVRLFRSSGGGYGSALSYPDFADYRRETRTLAGLTAWSSPISTTGRADGEVLQLQVGVVADNYFDVLGVRPQLGRFFRPDENVVPEGHPVAVISWGFWTRELGGRPDAIGRTVTLNERAFTVIGVVPRAFRGVLPTETLPDLFVPVMMLPTLSPQGDEAWRLRDPENRSNWLYVVGRLAPGTDVAAAQAELATIAARIYPAQESEDAETVLVTSRYRWYPSTWDSLSRLTTLLLATVLVLLIVAGANVTVLLLARATTRQREIGIRSALGAARRRLLRQLLAESLLLGLVGGAIGVVLSLWISRVVGAFLPVALDLPLAPDPRVLGAALALSVAMAVVVGTAPAWRASGNDVAGLMQGRTRHAGGGTLRDGLVVFQVALSLVLVTGTALFARSLMAARHVDMGFATDHRLLVSLNLGNRHYDAAQGASFVQRAMAELEALPGVEAVTLTGTVPFRDEWSTSLQPWAGSGPGPDSEPLMVGLNTVPAGYFATLEIPLAQGRALEAGDGPGAPDVVVVNEAFARTFFPDGNALGQSVPLRQGRSFTIVGIAKDATYYTFGEAPQFQVYFALPQVPRGRFALVIKTRDDPLTLATAVVRVINSIDPGLPVGRVESLQSLYDAQLASYRTSANVVGLAGVLALLLACTGLFGVMAFRVAQQTREIGVRMALGASRGRVAAAVFARGLRLTTIGVVLGLIGSLALGRAIEGFLYAVPARDPLSLLAAPVVLVVVATIAIAVPARRAMGVDPMGAIRTE